MWSQQNSPNYIIYNDPRTAPPPPRRIIPESGSVSLTDNYSMKSSSYPHLHLPQLHTTPSGTSTIRNMPPMPGVVKYLGDNSGWRLPEYPLDSPSRVETISAIVPELSENNSATAKQIIRNNGLYGIRGNLSCDLLKRSAVADHGFIQPLDARNAWLKYNSHDQLHIKDPYLIAPTKK